MADNLETSGVRVVAEGADKAVADLEKVNKSSEGLNKTLGGLGQNTSGLDRATEAVTKLGGAAGQAAPPITGLGGAGEAAGQGVAAGMTVATGAIAGIIAIAGAAVIAVRAIGSAVNSALAYASSISQISNSTGLSGGLAQSLSGGAAIGGSSVSGLTNTFNAFGNAAEAASERADKALAKVGAAADKSNTRLQRLNEDYARSIDDITTSAAERIADINERLVDAHASMLQRQSRLDEDYARQSAENQAGRARIDEDFNREIAENRASLAQRLTDIEQSAADSIAQLSERQSRNTDDYVRETASARDDLANELLDIETNLADRIEELNYRAAERSADAVRDGSKEQAKIQENLQKQLYDIEQKYSAKRQTLQEKIYDPNTNPILRAYYKTQLGSLDKLQKAEEDGARSGASAKQDEARRETEVRLSEIERGVQRERQIEEREAARRRGRLISEANLRQAERQREYQQQQADLAAQIQREEAQRAQQTARVRADNATREADLRRSYERQIADARARDAELKRNYDQQTADLRASYDEQVADAAEAQAKIQKETEKRLEAEKRQYDRAIEDINAALASAGGGASAAAVGIDKVARGFQALNIDIDAFKRLSPDEQFKLINKAIGDLVASGNTDKAIQAIMDITGGSREMAVQYINNIADMKEADKILKELGFTDEQIESARQTEKEFNTVKFALGLLGAQIGADFLPLVLELLKRFREWWEKHGPEVVRVVKDIGRFIVEKAVPAVGDLITFMGNLFRVVGDVTLTFQGFQAFMGRIVNGVLEDLRKKVETITNFFGYLKDKVDEVIGFINRIQLPSWINQAINGGLNVRFTGLDNAGANSFYGAGSSNYSNGRVQSVPATASQMAAGRSTASSTSTTTNTATVSVVVNGNSSRADVSKGVVDGLFKAGFTVVK